MSADKTTPDTNLDRWVGTVGLADFFDVSPRTIEGWRRRGLDPPGSLDPGGRWRYRLDEADAYMRERQRPIA